MILALLFIFATIALLGWGSSLLVFRRRHRLLLTNSQILFVASCFGTAVLLSIATWWFSMRMGVKALQDMETA
jgi:hypothetical protein